VGTGQRRVTLATAVSNQIQQNNQSAKARPTTLNERFSLIAQRRVEATQRQASNRFDMLTAKRTGSAKPAAKVVAAGGRGKGRGPQVGGRGTSRIKAVPIAGFTAGPGRGRGRNKAVPALGGEQGKGRGAGGSGRKARKRGGPQRMEE